MSRIFSNKEIFGRRIQEVGSSEGAKKGWQTRGGAYGSKGIGTQKGRDILAKKAKAIRVGGAARIGDRIIAGYRPSGFAVSKQHKNTAANRMLDIGKSRLGKAVAIRALRNVGFRKGKVPGQFGGYSSIG